MRLGLLPLGRNTFDVAFAEERLAAMLDRLDETGHELVGSRELLFDADATRAALTDLVERGVDRLLALQVTFTDAAMIVEAAETGLPMAIWAPPEPRLGGRLRLNAFCGLNLASHALGLRQHAFTWAYGAPEALSNAELNDLLTGEPTSDAPEVASGGASSDAARQVVAAVSEQRIARIGAHPDGFDTCAYDAARLKELAGVAVDELPLETLFDEARAADPRAVAPVRAQAEEDLTGLEAVDQAQLDRSLRLKTGLDALAERGPYGAFAVRCWPETFTEYGGAVCGPLSMMAERRVPCACEADVYGALSQMILQEAAASEVFLTDLVDVDPKDDSAVIWHCGQAPMSMRDPEVEATATIHTNRKMPLLYQFTLKPGRVTLMRVSQALGEPKMIIAGAEMLRRPMAFTGTSGVMRFDRPARAVLPDLIASGLEHHLVLAYGDHRKVLREVAAEMNLPVLEL